ncbi:MAG: DNA repair protein RecN, partial [Alphaproteobacteria bacterium]|nr:DNA repair protein RecN [Alphaproteobacteria bacterium]
MLSGLSIRDIVLIDRLDIEFKPGLSALTGETGAGKSILLDALGLALGERGDSGLVCHGAERGVVAAEFSVPAGHAALALLAEQGVTAEPPLVLRRVLAADGRSRAFANDQPIGVNLLHQIGATLVEIHGHNEQQGLLDSATHRALLDAFAGQDALVAEVGAAWRALRERTAAVTAATAERAAARAEEDDLRHAVAELDRLAPEPDEETTLAAERSILQQSALLGAALAGADTALGADSGVAARLGEAE